ncbi:MAG: transglutaminaseTgpA domain-containing protein, partial [Microcoleaceae cyanobacterium]
MAETALKPKSIGQIWQYIQNTPPPVTEESITLRVLVQALVIVGMIGVDVAAGVATNEIPISLWAGPLSMVGAIWSYQNRHKRNIPAKFAIALMMLLSLAWFLQNLISELTDTRLTLAELLIQLQVWHSFDLPRRKDLGYSMVIGLILIGVAGTLSQTLTFAPVLFVFLAIAIPTLIFDYRSRLDIEPAKSLQTKRPAKPGKSSLFSQFTGFSKIISPRQFILLFAVTLFLGLGIFAVLPRLPGYQLRTFPISTPIDMNLQDFDGRTITNPGYVGQGNQDGEGSGPGGENKEAGPGAMDTTQYYGFNTKINQNLRGELIPQVVLRVRSQAAGFWRVLSFDRYTGEGWEISENEKTTTIPRSRWSYQFYLFVRNFQSKAREVIQSYTVVSQLPNLIPALFQPKEIYFPTDKIAVDAQGNLRSPLELREGLTYTVISEVPYRNQELLSKASTNYSERIKKLYLQIPPAIADKVREKTEEILALNTQVAQNKKNLDSSYEKALYLAQYLKQNPNYQLQQEPPFLREGEDLVSAFLFGYKDSPQDQIIKGGYGDHFSTVLTVMLRSIGIPARLVAGFSPGEFNPFTGMYVVKNTDAHAMTEVYFPNYGWFAFNPIPGMPLIPPSIEENQTFSALLAFWQWVAGWLPTPVSGFLERFVGGILMFIGGILVWLFSLFSQGWQGIFGGLIAF